jgi:hypothetical protein
MKLPNRIFFTGVPGSRWSGIAQQIETIPDFNTSDRTPEREYSHGQFSGHKGAYFGPGMEFEAVIDSPQYLDQAWTQDGGTRLVKSHDWAYVLPDIQQRFPNDWIMLVYRPDMTSFAWWHEAGGFNIKYPSYEAYRDSTTMMTEIARQNQAILDFACQNNATWEYFTPEWCEKTFGHKVNVSKTWPDILVTVIKNEH